MFSRKTCYSCSVRKPEKDFHSDRSAKDGLAASCKDCRNARRRNSQFKADKKSPSHPTTPTQEKPVLRQQEATTTSSKIRVQSEGSLEDTLRKISEKYDSHYVISVSKNGGRLLHIQSPTSVVLKGDNTDVLLEKALNLATSL